MGLPAYIGQMLFAENAYKPINGDVGFIGKQTTYLRPASLDYLSNLYKHKPPRGLPPEIDNSAEAQGRFITDRYLMRYLGAKSVKSISVRDGEAADIAFDIGGKLPGKLKGSFDFIYDGSCLGAVFNPAAALCNMSRLLRPGGRALLVHHGTWLNGPFSIMSPGWYFDYFVANAYDDCQVFLCFVRGQRALNFGPVPVVLFNWSAGITIGNVPDLPEGCDLMVVVLAEKGRKSTDDAAPVQSLYRDQKYETTVFKKNVQRIIRSPRRHFATPQDLAADPSPFISLDTLGVGIPL